MKLTRLSRRVLVALCAGAWFAVHAAGAGAQAGKPSAKKSATPGERAAAKRETKPSSAQRKVQLQGEQLDLQRRLAQLRKQLAASEAAHADVTDALRASEAAISSANRRLRELASQRADLEARIADLQDRNRAIVSRQTEQERQFGLVLRTQFVLGRTSPWQKLLDGESPGQLGRDLQYLNYIGRAKSQLISELRTRRDELASLEAESRIRQAELAAVAAEEQSNRATLLQQQALHRQTLNRVSKQIAAQRQSLASMQRDERRLSSLIEQLSKLLADQSRRRERSATARPPARSTGPAAADVEPPASSAFAQLRGRLALPVQGDITARFGSPRRTEAGVDAPTWKGVFIRAAPGTEVHAIAAGRVIFADWLRGFGNLLIVDHGEGFMSVYGNNSTLMRSVGERVGRGDVIAEVGNTGGNTEPGLYFELRYQGQPMDPLRWAAAR